MCELIHTASRVKERAVVVFRAAGCVRLFTDARMPVAGKMYASLSG